MDMPFFRVDDTGRLHVSPQLWIYALITLPLTLVLFFWQWQVQRRKRKRKRDCPSACHVAVESHPVCEIHFSSGDSRLIGEEGKSMR
jgi:hypothetical protein